MLFGILMATALPLYFVQVDQFVGRRVLVENIHTWSGVALPVPLIISLAGPWGERLRRDVRRINLWTAAELRWLWSLGPATISRTGQVQSRSEAECALHRRCHRGHARHTGSILKWYRFFPLDWRTGATFVHDVLALAIFVVVFGHIAFALTHRDALRSMFRGWVTESWARRHASAWLKEEESEVKEQESSVHAVVLGRRPVPCPRGSDHPPADTDRPHQEGQADQQDNDPEQGVLAVSAHQLRVAEGIGALCRSTPARPDNTTPMMPRVHIAGSRPAGPDALPERSAVPSGAVAGPRSSILGGPVGHARVVAAGRSRYHRRHGKSGQGADRLRFGERRHQGGPVRCRRGGPVGRQDFEVVTRQTVPDGVSPVSAALSELATGFHGLVVTTGAPDSRRPISPPRRPTVLEREAPGLAEAMRAISPLGRLSRGTSGTIGSCLVVNVPGSPAGAVESIGAIIDVIPHALELLGGGRPH